MGKQGLILSQRKKPRENWRRCGEQSLGGILWEWEEVALSEQELMYQTSFPKELFSRPLCGFCAIKKLKKLEMASAAKLQTAGVSITKNTSFFTGQQVVLLYCSQASCCHSSSLSYNNHQLMNKTDIRKTNVAVNDDLPQLNLLQN